MLINERPWERGWRESGHNVFIQSHQVSWSSLPAAFMCLPLSYCDFIISCFGIVLTHRLAKRFPYITQKFSSLLKIKIPVSQKHSIKFGNLNITCIEISHSIKYNTNFFCMDFCFSKIQGFLNRIVR